MKTNKYIIIAISFLAIMSCADDDFSRAYVDNEVKTDLVGTIQLDRTQAAQSTLIGFTVTVPQTFTVDANVQVTANKQVHGAFASYDESVVTVTVPAGATTASGSIAMPGSTSETSDWGGITDYAEIAITGLALAQPEDGSIADPYVMTSEPVSLTALTRHSSWMGPNTNTLKVLLDWEGPYDERDLDLYIYDINTFIRYEVSWSGSRFEGDWFNNPGNENHPDGDFGILVDIPAGYYTGSGDVPYFIHLTHPDGRVEMYEGTIVASETLIGTNFWAVFFTKTTDGDGNATYTTSAGS